MSWEPKVGDRVACLDMCWACFDEAHRGWPGHCKRCNGSTWDPQVWDWCEVIAILPGAKEGYTLKICASQFTGTFVASISCLRPDTWVARQSLLA